MHDRTFREKDISCSKEKAQENQSHNTNMKEGKSEAKKEVKATCNETNVHSAPEKAQQNDPQQKVVATKSAAEIREGVTINETCKKTDSSAQVKEDRIQDDEPENMVKKQGDLFVSGIKRTTENHVIREYFQK